MTGLYQVYERGQTHFQVGNNTNLFDWTYVGNVARAHILAADKLDIPPPAPPISAFETAPSTADDLPPLTSAEQSLISHPLTSIDLTTGKHRIPTCEARPLGPYVTRPPNAEIIESAFNNPGTDNRPVGRSRYDQLSETSINRAKLLHPDKTPLQVAGQVFFITNGEPCYFWDFPRTVWRHLDSFFPGHRKQRGLIVLPKPIGMAAASGSEWFGWLTGKQPTFTKFKVTFSCATRWYNIEKARRVLGYEPEIGVEEGVRRMVEVCSRRLTPCALILTLCVPPVVVALGVCCREPQTSSLNSDYCKYCYNKIYLSLFTDLLNTIYTCGPES